MNRHGLLMGWTICVLTSLSLAFSAVAASATVHSLSFAGEVFQYSGGVLSSTTAHVRLTYDQTTIITGIPYHLDFSGFLTGGGTSNGLLTGVQFAFKDGGGNTVFSGIGDGAAHFYVNGNSASILGNYMDAVATNPVPGLAPKGSYAIGLSGWNGVITSPSGSGGTFTAVPEAGSSAAMALLIAGGCVVGFRNRRK